MTHLVEVRGLAKCYGGRHVLRGIDLDIPRGSVTAVVGPNGAGKTTLNKILLGLVHADSGSLRFDRVDMRRQVSYRARIGYMPQAARFPENLTGREVLDLLRAMRNDVVVFDRTLLLALGVDALLDRPIREYSGGQRQQLNASLAMLFRPELMLLDEPTAGLDPVASSILKDTIRVRRDEGRAILVTSHILSEVEELADRVVFLLDGSIRYSGTVDALLGETQAPTLERAIAHVMIGTAA